MYYFTNNFLAQLWMLTNDMKLKNRAGIRIFGDKKWNIPDEGTEGYVEEQEANEVLGFEDITLGELMYIVDYSVIASELIIVIGDYN